MPKFYEDDKSYYSLQLDKVIPAPEKNKGRDASYVKIKIVLDDRSTKWMSLNLDCIDSLEEYISMLKKELE